VAAAPTVVRVAALQTSPTGSVNVISVPETRLPPGRFAGSVIEMELTAVVPDVGSVTAGVFDDTLNHDTLASVGTLKVVAARPSVA
jgi:hypothetical protein